VSAGELPARAKAAFLEVKARLGHPAWTQSIFPYFYDAFFARAILGFLLAASLVGIALRVRDPRTATFASLAVLLLLSPTLHPWYLLWILPFAAERREPAFLYLSFAAPLSYLLLKDGAVRPERSSSRPSTPRLPACSSRPCSACGRAGPSSRSRWRLDGRPARRRLDRRSAPVSGAPVLRRNPVPRLAAAAQRASNGSGGGGESALGPRGKCRRSDRRRADGRRGARGRTGDSLRPLPAPRERSRPRRRQCPSSRRRAG
jgi:hypothetical protein